MHMADALISPGVGGTMGLAAGYLVARCARKLKKETDQQVVPLMGVMGAFVFAAQMINFSIPGTGSSGHLGGGLLLAALLGPHAAFLTMASILTVQALFFADGGILALGCNIFNLGFYTCFIAYPLVYRKIMKKEFRPIRLYGATIAAAVISLQLGAFSVVIETFLSGRSDLPMRTFAMLMQPIHLMIGIVEGIVTAAVLRFVYQAKPHLVDLASSLPTERGRLPRLLGSLLIIAMLTGGVLSWFASRQPDGLEWSLFKLTGKEEPQGPRDGSHAFFANLQNKIALLPDYAFKKDVASQGAESWPAPDVGRSLSGLVGGLLTLMIAVGIGFMLKRGARMKKV